MSSNKRMSGATSSSNSATASTSSTRPTRNNSAAAVAATAVSRSTSSSNEVPLNQTAIATSITARNSLSSNNTAETALAPPPAYPIGLNLPTVIQPQSLPAAKTESATSIYQRIKKRPISGVLNSEADAELTW